MSLPSWSFLSLSKGKILMKFSSRLHFPSRLFVLFWWIQWQVCQNLQIFFMGLKMNESRSLALLSTPSYPCVNTVQMSAVPQITICQWSSFFCQLCKCCPCHSTFQPETFGPVGSTAEGLISLVACPLLLEMSLDSPFSSKDRHRYQGGPTRKSKFDLLITLTLENYSTYLNFVG